ncbi:IPT/TIG domain-containing protein [Acidobacteriota bacterium]
MKKLTNIIFIILCIFIFSQCDPSGGNGEDNPAPTLTAISPAAKVSNMPSFTLTATGTDFISGSQIVFDGTPKPTTFVSATEITCQVDSADIPGRSATTTGYENISGALSTNVPVLVRNPLPGGGDSTSINFTINDDHTFKAPVSIYGPGRSTNPRIALDNTGNIYIAWHEALFPNGEEYFIHSTDNGSTWGAAVNISNSSGRSAEIDIAVDSGGNIDLVWLDTSAAFKQDIYFTRSTNNGSTWSSITNISNRDGAERGSPVIAVDSSGNINVAWIDNYTGDFMVMFNRSTNNGSTWGSNVNITDYSKDRGVTDIAMGSTGDIYVLCDYFTPSPLPVISEDEIYFRRSTNNGATWGAAVNVSNTAAHSRNGRMAVDSIGDINLVWNDDTPGNAEILFSRSTNSGTTWSWPLNISGNSGVSWTPDIAMDSAGNIHVVWVDSSSGVYEIYFSRSTDNGATWSTAVNISNSANSAKSRNPRIAVDSAGDIHVVWYDYISSSGSFEVLYTNSIL